MNPGVALSYQRCQSFSRWSTLIAILALSLTKFVGIELPISSQLVIALTALALGIPHGAIDHLITLPRKPPQRFYAFIVLYVALAIVAAACIARWERIGFISVIIMSGLHFGFGDAAFKNEFKDFQDKKRISMLSEIFYALPAGFAPLLLPLTDSTTASALKRINSHLINWAGGTSHLLRVAMLVTALGALVFMIVRREFDNALDLSLLIALAITAPPLITFAIYFGCWHAIRHTARLVPKLDMARNLASSGKVGAALWAAIFPGLYALVGTVALAAILMIAGPSHFSMSLLWATLVLVWALTVPHMLTTARFDISALT